MGLPMSSKRSTQTTNTFVSGPSGGKDFPDDDLLLFTRGLSYTKHRVQSKKNPKRYQPKSCGCRINIQLSGCTFLDDSRFSEWLGNSSSVRLCCFSKAGMSSVLVSASTVESLCTDDSSGKQQKSSVNPSAPHREGL